MDNIFRTLAHHPKLMKRWLVFGNHILSKSSLDPRDRELAILRIGWLCRAEYEWGQHVPIGLAAGLTDEEIARIPDGPAAEGWDGKDRAILTAVDELHADAFVTDATWQALQPHFDPQQLMDFVFTVGQYNLVSMVLNTFGVQLDDRLSGFPRE
jgi:alkylhydroperoxidase family enzyme